MDVERVDSAILAGGSLVAVWLTGPELNRLRFDASIACATSPGKYPALDEFLEASETA